MRAPKFLVGVAAVLVSMVNPSFALTNTLNMVFSNTSTISSSNIWISLQRSSISITPGVKYGTNSFSWSNNFIFSDPVSLSTINSNSGITWKSNAPSTGIYVSYGAKLNATTTAPSPINPSDLDYNTPYQNFEITYNPNPGDQADVTAINWFTAPVSLAAYSGGLSGTNLGTLGYNASTATIYNALVNAAGGNATAVLTSTNGTPTRILGPTTYGNPGFGPYPTFDNYLQAMVNQTNRTVFGRNGAYNTIPAGTPTSSNNYTNASLTFFMTNMVTNTSNGYKIDASGYITGSFLTYTNGHIDTNNPLNGTTTNWTNITFTSDPNGLNNTILSNAATRLIYSGNPNENPNNNYIVDGTNATNNWYLMTNWLVSNGFYDGNDNTVTGVPLTVFNTIAGEISAGYTFGYVGSPVTNALFDGGMTNIGSMVSSNWWGITNAFFFAQAQPSNSFYSAYAEVIALYSSNQIYGTPYGDRFTALNPAINVVSNQNQDVDTLLVTLGDPVSVVPEPQMALAAAAAVVGFALIQVVRGKIRRRKSA